MEYEVVETRVQFMKAPWMLGGDTRPTTERALHANRRRGASHGSHAQGHHMIAWSLSWDFLKMYYVRSFIYLDSTNVTGRWGCTTSSLHFKYQLHWLMMGLYSLRHLFHEGIRICQVCQFSTPSRFHDLHPLCFWWRSLCGAPQTAR